MQKTTYSNVLIKNQRNYRTVNQNSMNNYSGVTES